MTLRLQGQKSKHAVAREYEVLAQYDDLTEAHRDMLWIGVGDQLTLLTHDQARELSAYLLAHYPDRRKKERRAHA